MPRTVTTSPARLFGAVAPLGHAEGVTTPSSAPGSAAGPALDVAVALRAQLGALDFPLELPGVEEIRTLRDRITTQLDSHLVPRLRTASLPTIVVVGGPTGAGKSTLVNAVSGTEVSPAGVVRPTTKKPVLVVNPADRELIADHPVSGRAAVVEADLPRGLALLDAPDLDSVEVTNRERALELVEVADVWLFVTTANRYGDAVPWAVLEQVKRRGVTVGVVLDRIGPEALDTVRRDLLARLADAGFGSVPLFVVPDAGPLDGPLPKDQVVDVERWLTLVAGRHGSHEVVARTIRGVWSPLREETRRLLDASVAQAEAAADLSSAARTVVEPVEAELAERLRSGILTDGAPTSRWLADASGKGALAAVAHPADGFFARRRAQRQAPERARALAALRGDLHRAFTDVAGAASRTVADVVELAWTKHSTAGAALAAERRAGGVDEARRARVEETWQAWLASIPVPENPAEATPGLLGQESARTVVALAAAGLAGARAAAERLGLPSWRDALEDLVRACRECLESEALDHVDEVARRLPGESVTALRLRIAELRRLAGED
ncbi:50S ribosome-binding GTPase [Salana multivorans]|uniref:50S ribosome-binding GTPase n=1 Tax=Salana multivorans TaxID=120377 RepID=A0A3N2DE52_9MICO|nr:50S ribosome-binding GTPase [Salana multivorans]